MPVPREGEQGILYAAISVGLATKSPIRLVIIDKVDLHITTLNKLVRRLGELIAADKIDQALLAVTKPATETEMPDGVEFKQVEVVR